TYILARDRDDAPVGEPDQLPHLGSAFHRGMSEIEIHTDVSGIEVLHRKPEVPAASTDITRATFDVIYGRGAVLLIEFCEPLDARLPGVELRLQILAVVVLSQWRSLVITKTKLAHRIEISFGMRFIGVSDRSNDDGNLQSRFPCRRDRLWEVPRHVFR